MDETLRKSVLIGPLQAAASAAETSAAAAVVKADAAETAAAAASAAAAGAADAVTDAQAAAATATGAAATATGAAATATGAAATATGAAASATAAAGSVAQHFDGTISDFEAGSLAARGDGEQWFLVGDWGVAVFYETNTSPDFTNAAGVGLVYAGDEFDVRVWGLAGSGDETTEIQAMAQWASDNDLILIWPTDTQYAVSRLDFTGSHHWIGARIHDNRGGTPGTEDYCIDFAANEIGETEITSDFDVSRSNVVVDDPSIIEPDDFLRIRTTHLIPTDDRGSWTEGQLVRVSNKGGTTIRLTDVLEFSHVGEAHTGTISAISGDRYTLTCSNLPAGDDDLTNRRLLTITDGTSSGEERYIVSKSGSDVTHTDSWDIDPWPAGVQVGDAYNYEAKAWAIVYRPNKVTLEDCQITRSVVSDATSGDRNHWCGVRVVGADFVARDVVIEGFPEACLKTSYCYKPKVETCEFRYANMSYDEYGGLGYGWLVETCHAPLGRDILVFACRSGVNFSGSTGYTTHGRLERVEGVGGGKTYTGDFFWPTGTARQAVTGSHGSGLGTQYLDCVGRHTWQGHVIVGAHESVKGFRHYGAAFRSIWLGAGSFGATITDIAYEDQVSMDGTDNYQTLTNDDKRLVYVVGMEYAGTRSFATPTTIRGIRANAIMQAGVYVDTLGETDLSNLHVSDVHVRCRPDSADGYEDARVIAFSDDVAISNCEFYDNGIIALSPYANSVQVISMTPDPGDGTPFVSITDGGVAWIDGRAWLRVLDDEIASIPVRSISGKGVINLWHPDTGAARPCGYGIALESMTAVNQNTGAVTNKLELLAATPTDATTDVTAGNIGLNLNHAAGTLSVANNVGSAQTLVIDGI